MSVRTRPRGRQTQFHIELLYGVLFITGFAYLVFRVDPRVAAFEGGLVAAYLLRIWEKMSIYERIIEEAVAEEAEEAVAEEVEQEVEERVGDEVAEQVAQEVEPQVPDEVITEVEEGVDDEVEQRVGDELRELIDERVEERLADGTEQSTEGKT